MKTLYSKFNKARSPEFQIETRIYLDDEGNKKISKIALAEAAKAHIKHMAAYFESMQGNKHMLVKYYLKYDKIDFDFVEGNSFSQKLLLCVQKNDRITFMKYIQNYNMILNKLVMKSEVFIPTKAFVEVFGEVDGLTLTAAKNLNVDLIFENIIFEKDNTVKIIDYEWTFPFAIPIKFVVWRAVYGFYIKNWKALYEFITKETIYDIFDISVTEIKAFKAMDANFLQYIYGKKLNYENILSKYCCPKTEVLKKLSELEDTKKGYSQIFIDEGTGYSDRLCKTYEQTFEKDDRITLTLSLAKYKTIKNIRFDPLPFAGVVALHTCCLTDMDGNETDISEFLHNASLAFANYYVFETDDAQLIFSNQQNNRYAKVKIEFSYIPLDLFDKMIYVSAMQTADQKISILDHEILTLNHEISTLKKALSSEQSYAKKILLNKQELEKELIRNLEIFKEKECD